MRVCLLTPELPPHSKGGIGAYVECLANELHRRQHQVTVAGFDIHPQIVEDREWGTSHRVECQGIACFLLFFSKIIERAPWLWKWSSPLRSVVAASAINKWLKKHQDDFDIVEIPNWPGHGAKIRLDRCKLVVRLSSPASECGMSGNLVTRMEALSCQRAGLVIANSNAIVEKVLKPYKLQDARIAVIPHGTNEFDLQPPPSRRCDGIDLLYLGRAELRKGTDILLRALPPVFRADRNIRLRLAGFSPRSFLNAFPELEELWLQLTGEFADQFEVLGVVDEAVKLQLYASSHWCVIPSRFESFGLVAIEAMRAGTPIISSSEGGLSETIARSPSAQCVDPNTPEIWTKILMEIASNGVPFAEEQRDITRQAFDKHFTISRMASATIEQYKQIIA